MIIFTTTSTSPKQPIIEITNLTNAVKLDWEVTANTTSYTIYRSTTSGTLGAIVTNGENISLNTFTDTTALGGTTYYYTVQSKNDLGETTLSKQVTAIPSTIQLYDDRLIDFVGYTSWIVYGGTEVDADFGNHFTLQGGDRLKIDTAERLRFYLPMGFVGSANTGGIIKANIAEKTSYNFEYEIRFDTGFPWSKGGKIPGISGGEGYTGGEPATKGDGFSVRIMWREDGRLIPYVYHYDQPDKFGDTFGDTIGYLTDTKAYKIRYYVQLNTDDNRDGILRIFIDDVQVYEQTKICYRVDDCKIDTAHIAIFAGGSSEDWNMTADGYIRLSYVKWW